MGVLHSFVYNVLIEGFCGDSCNYLCQTAANAPNNTGDCEVNACTCSSQCRQTLVT